MIFWSRTAKSDRIRCRLCRAFQNHSRPLSLRDTDCGNASASNQQGYIQAAYNQILNSGETKIRYAEFPIRDWNGCSGHPTKAADLEVANYLAQFIQNLGL